MSAILTLFFRHNHWANLALLDVCARLTPAQLSADAPRTVGTIHHTLYHIAVNEARYLTVFDPDADDAIGAADEHLPDLAIIREQLDRSGRRFIELAAALEGDPVYPTEWQGRTMHVPASLPMLQAINHGTEHRVQIAGALRDLGIDPPVLDAWAYGAAQSR